MSRLSKQLHRILDGLENSPRQRNTDQPPCEYQLDCGRSGMIFGRHSISWGLRRLSSRSHIKLCPFSFILWPQMETWIYGLDEEIAEQPNH